MGFATLDHGCEAYVMGLLSAITSVAGGVTQVLKDVNDQVNLNYVCLLLSSISCFHQGP